MWAAPVRFHSIVSWCLCDFSLPFTLPISPSLSLSDSRELFESELHSPGQAGRMVTGRGGLALDGLSETLPGGNPDIRP